MAAIRYAESAPYDNEQLTIVDGGDGEEIGEWFNPEGIFDADGETSALTIYESATDRVVVGPYGHGFDTSKWAAIIAISVPVLAQTGDGTGVVKVQFFNNDDLPIGNELSYELPPGDPTEFDIVGDPGITPLEMASARLGIWFESGQPGTKYGVIFLVSPFTVEYIPAIPQNTTASLSPLRVFGGLRPFAKTSFPTSFPAA